MYSCCCVGYIDLVSGSESFFDVILVKIIAWSGAVVVVRVHYYYDLCAD